MKKIVQLLGPTGVGKSKLAVYIAGIINAEIISADSIQIYRHFNIGSSKITKEEMGDIEHHLIDILEPSADFNVNKFIQMSRATITGVEKKKKIPVVCGGTALYLSAMINGLFNENQFRRISRKKIMEIGRVKGYDYLWERLQKIDKIYAEKIGSNDKKRIVRGLEIYYNNHVIPSNISRITIPPFSDHDFIRIGLILPRDQIYQKINIRVDKMIESGLVDEVRSIRGLYGRNCTPLESIGYREIGMYLDSMISLESAIDQIKQHSRNFAKRQLSWFRREKAINWFPPDKTHEILLFLEKELKDGKS